MKKLFLAILTVISASNIAGEENATNSKVNKLALEAIKNVDLASFEAIISSANLSTEDKIELMGKIHETKNILVKNSPDIVDMVKAPIYLAIISGSAYKMGLLKAELGFGQVAFLMIGSLILKELIKDSNAYIKLDRDLKTLDSMLKLLTK